MCQLHDTFLWPRTSSSVPALGISHNLLHRHTPACWNPVGTKSYKTKALRNIVHMSVNLLTPCQDKSSSPAHTHTAIGSVPNNLTLSLPASLRHQLSSGTASLSTSCLLSPRPALMSPRLFAVALMMATLVLTLSSAQGRAGSGRRLIESPDTVTIERPAADGTMLLACTNANANAQDSGVPGY
jgi:hypothetical protein